MVFPHLVLSSTMKPQLPTAKKGVGRVMGLETSVSKGHKISCCGWFKKCMLKLHMTLCCEVLFVLTSSYDSGLKAVTFIFLSILSFTFRSPGKPAVNTLAHVSQCVGCVIILLFKSQCILPQKIPLYLSEE